MQKNTTVDLSSTNPVLVGKESTINGLDNKKVDKTKVNTKTPKSKC